MFYPLPRICLSDVLWRHSDRQLTDVVLPSTRLRRLTRQTATLDGWRWTCKLSASGISGQNRAPNIRRGCPSLSRLSLPAARGQRPPLVSTG